MEERPNRRQLRLPDYDYSAPGAYFITICTDKRREILSTVFVGADAHIGPQVRLTTIGQIAEKYICSIPGIDRYVIMPNHIHMIINIGKADGSMWASTPTKSISSIVRSFKTLVSKEVGGSIWQRSFYDHVIRSEAEYLCVWEYIDSNPARWSEDEYYCDGTSCEPFL